MEARTEGGCGPFIEGARRIGKSYIVEEFARNEYDSYNFDLTIPAPPFLSLQTSIQKETISFCSLHRLLLNSANS